MRILIIGGTAFMGPATTRALTEMGHEVTVFHRGKTEGDLPSEVQHIHGPALAFDDRRVLVHFRDTFRQMNPDVVLDMILMTEAAARTTMEVFRGIARRIVVASSEDVYAAYGQMLGFEAGPAAPVPAGEDSALRQRLYPYRGETPRGADDPQRWTDDYDKILVERIVLGDPDLPGTVVRLPMVYGPGDKQHRLFEYARRMADQRPFILLDQGLADWRTARGYVEDMGRGLALAVSQEQAAGKIYNLAEPQALTEREWVQAIGRVAGWKGEVVAVPGEALPEALRADFNPSYSLVADTRRIRAELGYREGIDRDTALQRTIGWELAHPPEGVTLNYAAEDAAWRAWNTIGPRGR